MKKVYEKKVNNVRHLFFTETGIPEENDVQVTYTDKDGADITPVLEDKFECGPEHSINWTHEGTTKELRAWADDYNIIPGGLTKPTPTPASGYKHTIMMVAGDDDSGDVEFNVTIENDDATEFTNVTLEAWLASGGYTTAADNYYDNVETIAGTPNVIGVASKGGGAVVAEFEGGGGTDTTFFRDTVTPANK